MFKSKKMRAIVEHELEWVNKQLIFAEENNLTISIANYTAQKVELEYILREFNKLEA